MRLRVATLDDLAALLPARLPRRHWQAYTVQLKRSAAFAAVDDAGVFAVGGLYADEEAQEREVWLHLRASPRVRVRDVLEAVLTVLEAAGEGWPIVAHVDASSAKNLRFVEFLGFVSLHEVPASSFAPRSIKLVRSVIDGETGG